MTSTSFDYFRRRAAEERERAWATTDVAIRAVHLDFAQRYDRASGSMSTAHELRSSRAAIARSLELLSATAPGNDW